MTCKHEKLIVDIYCEMETKDLNENLELDLGDLRCPECNLLFNGKLKLSDIVGSGTYQDEREFGSF